jgi:two-component system, cell cycle response regulator
MDKGEKEGKPTSRGQVLVVDDSRLVRLMVLAILRRGGYEADEADCGAAGLGMLARKTYDVVITDLKMPGMDGFDVLSGVKRIAPNVEVVVLTGTHAQDVTCAIKALRLGAHDFLSKPPTSPDAVLLTIERAVEKKRLKDANQRLLTELENLSRTDALTGVSNRRSFDEALGKEFTRARRHGHGLGVVMLDIDHFKVVNDTYGHPGGDQVLRAFAGIIASVLREGDTLFRFGGEEFVVLLPHTEREGALCAAQRIVAAVASAPIRMGGDLINITTSAGVGYLEKSTRDGVELLGKADAALYEAKSGGRNRAMASGPRLSLVSAS